MGTRATRSTAQKRETKDWTVLELINWTAGYLSEKGIDQPRLTAERMLGHVLGCRRLDLYLQFDRPLVPPDLEVYKQLLKRRVQGCPLQYILGETEFFSLPFKVRPPVLIPRSETEILVEKVLDRLRTVGEPPVVADIGTGSGNIAVSLAHAMETAQVYATDICPDALRLSVENAQCNGVAERIIFLEGDLMEPLEEAGLYDTFHAIVCNPPYIRRNALSALPVEIRNYESPLALDGGPDGLQFYQRLSMEAGPFLHSEGWMAVEVGDGQVEAVQKILHRHPEWGIIEVEQDLNGIERVIIAEKW